MLRCLEWSLNISCKDHVTEVVCRKVLAAFEEYDDVQVTETEVVWLQLKDFLGRPSNSAVHRDEKGRRGRQKKRWEVFRNGQGWTY